MTMIRRHLVTVPFRERVGPEFRNHAWTVEILLLCLSSSANSQHSSEEPWRLQRKERTTAVPSPSPGCISPRSSTCLQCYKMLTNLVRPFSVAISFVAHVIAASVAWIAPSSSYFHGASVAALLLTCSALPSFCIGVNCLFSGFDCHLQGQDGDRQDIREFLKHLLLFFAFGIAAITALTGSVFIAIGLATAGLDGRELAAGVSTIIFAGFGSFVDLTAVAALVWGAFCIPAYEPLDRTDCTMHE